MKKVILALSAKMASGDCVMCHSATVLVELMIVRDDRLALAQVQDSLDQALDIIEKDRERWFARRPEREPRAPDPGLVTT